MYYRMRLPIPLATIFEEGTNNARRLPIPPAALSARYSRKVIPSGSPKGRKGRLPPARRAPATVFSLWRSSQRGSRGPAPPVLTRCPITAQPQHESGQLRNPNLPKTTLPSAQTRGRLKSSQVTLQYPATGLNLPVASYPAQVIPVAPSRQTPGPTCSFNTISWPRLPGGWAGPSYPGSSLKMGVSPLLASECVVPLYPVVMV